jgi:PAS domain S-box-containing protein
VANLVALALAEYEAYEAKRQAQLANEQLHAVINASQDALLLADERSGKILDVNRQTEVLTGRSREELLGRHHGILYGDTRQHKPTVDNWLGGGCPSGLLAAEVQRADGRRIMVNVTTEKAELSNGNRLCLNTLRAA